jgi:hypothetical protein
MPWPCARRPREPRILLAAAATDMSVCMLLACACECDKVGEIELQQYLRSMQQARPAARPRQSAPAQYPVCACADATGPLRLP